MIRAVPPTLLALFVAGCSGHTSQADAAQARDAAAQALDAGSAWTLLWSDDFDGPDGSSPDPSKWMFDTGGGGWGNAELEDYTSRTDNAVIQQGHLVITAKQESFQGSQYTSARLKTAGKFAFTYGRVEMSARLPQGPGMWPAFWMLGANIATVPWPGCGEIDIMEFVGKTPTRIYGTIHGPNYSGANGIGAWHLDPSGFSGTFHQYAIEWDPGVIRWYYDGVLYEERSTQDLAGNTWVYDHDFFILLNLAIGGNFPGPPDHTTVFPQSYMVDYVRVYQRSSALPSPPVRHIIALKSRLDGKYVSADKNNGDLLSADRQSASTWESYEPKDLGGGQTALWALSEDKYVTGSAGGGNPLAAGAETVGPPETFTFTTNADGSTSLRLAAGGKYVTVPNNGNSPLQAIATVVTTAEEFDVIAQ